MSASESESEAHSMVSDSDGEVEAASDAGEAAPAVGDKRFALPSADEMQQLRETEDLMKTNLLRMQMDELLEEVRVDYSKLTALRDALFELKAVIEAIPEQKVTARTLAMPGLPVRDYKKEAVLNFRPPSRVDVVGSFLLRTLARPDLNVDLAVQLPMTRADERGHLNFTFYDLRALYLGVVAQAVQQHSGFEVEGVAAFAGDVRKPVLVLRATAKGARKFRIRILPTLSPSLFKLARLAPNRNNVRRPVESGAPLPPTPTYNTGLLEDMMVRTHLAQLHAAVEQCPGLVDAITLAKVWLRQRHFLASRPQSPSSFHIAMLLVHLVQQRKVTKQQSAYQIFRVLLQYLADSDELLRGAAMRAWQPEVDAEEAAAAAATAGPSCTEEELAVFRTVFPVVLVDGSGALNLFARVSREAYDELRREAVASMQLLQSQPLESFRPLFMARAPTLLKYDQTYCVRVHYRAGAAEGEAPTAASFVSEIDAALDAGGAVALCTRLARLLERGLGARLRGLRVLPRYAAPPTVAAGAAAASDAEQDLAQVGGLPQWSLHQPPPHVVEVWACLLLDFAGGALDTVMRGPNAEDAEAAARFRAFWRDRAELRRFKDGSILETVVWDVPESRAHTVPFQVLQHVVRYHMPPPAVYAMPHDPVPGPRFVPLHVVGAEPHGAGAVQGKPAPKRKGKHAARGADRPALGGYTPRNPLQQADPWLLAVHADPALATRRLQAAFDGLAVQLKGLSELPLRVNAVQPVSASLRYTSLHPPVPHPLATADPVQGAQAAWLQDSGARLDWMSVKPHKSRVVEPVEAVLVFESSGKWPDNPVAIEKTKIAILMRIKTRLEAEHGLRCFVTDEHLDVLKDGFAFRFRVHHARQHSLLRALVVDKRRVPAAQQGGASAAWSLLAGRVGEQLAPAEAAQLLARLEVECVRRPQHALALHGFHRLRPAFGPTVRLARRWLLAHLFAAHVREEALELLVAALFVGPAAPAAAAPAAAAAAPAAAAADTTCGAPGSAVHGLYRLMRLLATHDWAGAPLVVDLDGSVTPADRADILRVFAAVRDTGGPPASSAAAGAAAAAAAAAAAGGAGGSAAGEDGSAGSAAPAHGQLQRVASSPLYRHAVGAVLAGTHGDAEAAASVAGGGEQGARGPAMYLVSPHDRASGWLPFWTVARPGPVVLRRLCAFAAATARTLERLWLHGHAAPEVPEGASEGGAEEEWGEWDALFRTPLHDYDAVVHLRADCLRPYAELAALPDVRERDAGAAGKRKRAAGAEAGSEDGEGGQARKRGAGALAPLFRNMVDAAAGNLLVGLDPVQLFVREVELRHGHRLLAFPDLLRRDKVALVWRPPAFEAAAFKVAQAAATRPVVLDASGRPAGGVANGTPRRASKGKGHGSDSDSSDSEREGGHATRAGSAPSATAPKFTHIVPNFPLLLADVAAQGGELVKRIALQSGTPNEAVVAAPQAL